MKLPRSYYSYADLREQTLEDESTSPWLTGAILELDDRDPIDALNDAAALCEFCLLTGQPQHELAITALDADSAASYWLKSAVSQIESLDPVDADQESKTLHILCHLRFRDISRSTTTLLPESH